MSVFAAVDVDFYGTLLNDSETAEVLVENTGYGASATMTLNSVSSSNASFAVSSTGLPVTLAAGGSASVEVTFTPTAEGDYEGYMIFAHSGASSPDSVMVSGFGVDAYFYEGFDPFTGSYTDLPMDGWTILDNNEDADSIPQRFKTW